MLIQESIMQKCLNHEILPSKQRGKREEDIIDVESKIGGDNNEREWRKS